MSINIYLLLSKVRKNRNKVRIKIYNFKIIKYATICFSSNSLIANNYIKFF